MSYITPRPGRPRPWVAEITDPRTGKVDHTRSFVTKAEARDYITEQEHTKLHSAYVSPRDGRITFGERWEQWFPTVVKLRPSSRARDECYARAQVLPRFEHVALIDIDHDMISAWVADLVSRGYAPSTVHKAHGVLSKALKGAVAQRLLASNPCEHTELPEIVINEQMFLTYEQVEDLIDEIDPRFRLAVRLAAYTGLRAGELFGLRARDVMVEGTYINVVRKLVEVKGRLHFDDYLKTNAGRRQISVPAAVMDELEIHLDGADPDDLVFRAAKGGPVRLSTWRRRIWYPATIECGFGSLDPCTAGEDGEDGEPMACGICGQADPKRKAKEGHRDGLRLHDLRHTAVSFWIDQGRSMFEITKMLGQRNSDLVDRRYGHLIPKEHDAANDKLNARMLEAKARKQGKNVTPFKRRRGVA